MLWTRDVLALLLITALLQGSKSFDHSMGAPVGLSQSTGGGLQQLLSEFGLKDAIGCLEQNGVYDHVRMSMLTEHDVDEFGHKCNLPMMMDRMLNQNIPDLVQRT